MHSAIFKVFLGLLFQLNYYGFKGIDILPDVIGYYFIFQGLKTLAGENHYFEIANKLILPILVLSLVKLYNFQYHQELLVSFFSALEIIKIIVLALNMYLVYNLCKGAIEVAISIKDEYLEQTIAQRLYLYLGVAGVLLILSIISLLPFEGLASLQFVFTIMLFVYLCVLIIMVAGIFSLYRQLAPARVKPVESKMRTKKGGKPIQSKRKR